MYDKYLRRDCELQPELKDLCYAQFVKRYANAKKSPETPKSESLKVPKVIGCDGNLVFKDKIVTKNMEEEDSNSKLPKYIRILSPYDEEPSFMTLRDKEIIL